ncbi:MAG: hypothetical protein ACREEK_28175 [Bradyrhizobium sp.]
MIDVRYSLIATKFHIGTKQRDVPNGDIRAIAFTLVKQDPHRPRQTTVPSVQSSLGRLSERLAPTAIIVVRLLDWGDVTGRDAHPK